MWSVRTWRIAAPRHPHHGGKAMPNGIYPVPPLHSRENDGRAPASRPGLPLRLRTWWRRNRLDEQLANGIDPRTNAQLTLRAQQLVTTVGRARLADDLDGVLRQGRGQAPQIHRLVRRGQVRACSDATGRARPAASGRSGGRPPRRSDGFTIAVRRAKPALPRAGERAPPRGTPERASDAREARSVSRARLPSRCLNRAIPRGPG